MSPTLMISKTEHPSTRVPASEAHGHYAHRPHDPSQLKFALSAEQVQQYHDDGFLVIRGIFSEEETARWRDIQIQLMEERPELFQLDNLRFEWANIQDENDPESTRPFPWKIDPFSDLHPELAVILRDRRICDALASIYDNHEPRIFKEKYIIKPPGSRGNGIHQDYNWWQGFPKSCLSVAVAIDGANKENGCTQLWRGSHKHGFLHKEGELGGGIPADYYAEEPFYLETNPGDICIFNCYTIHAAGSNESDRFRRQLFLSYNDSRDGEHYFAHRQHFWSYRVRYEKHPENMYFE